MVPVSNKKDAGPQPAGIQHESLAQPGNTKLAALVNTVFKGETLRGMLLNAYGWWKVSQIMYIAALISFGLAALALIGSGTAIIRGRRASADAEIFVTKAQHAKAA